MSELVIAEKSDLMGIANEVRQLTGQTKSLSLQEMQTGLKSIETLPKDGNPGDILVKTETGSTWQSFVEDMIEEDMLPAVKIGNDILGVKNDILMM